MTKKKTDNNGKKRVRTSSTKIKLINDGMNTPVPDSTSTHVPSESEAALIKQANNPLGDPNKI
jgi:hypothetical protein